jgi:hypothetical protein
LASGSEEKLKKNPHALEVKGDQGIEDPVFRLDCVDALQLRVERFDAELVDGRLVHAGGIKVADLLVHGGALRIVGRSLVQDSAEYSAIAIRQHVEGSPRGLVGGDGIVGHPGSAGVSIEIDARVGGHVHVGGEGPWAWLRQSPKAEEWDEKDQPHALHQTLQDGA